MTDSAAQRFRKAAASIQSERVDLGWLCGSCGTSSCGPLLALLGALCILPVPGVGTLLGTGVVAMAVAMWHGRMDEPLSQRIRGFELSRAWAQRVLRALGLFQSVGEKVARPRWAWIVGALAQRRMATLVGMLGVLITLPIPFGNFFPALALVCVGMGMPAKDGALLLVGAAMSVVGLIWPGALLVAGWQVGSEWLGPVLTLSV